MTAFPVIPVAEPDLGPLEEQYVLEAMRSGWVSSIGAFIDRFEKQFAELCGVKHCVALSNGTVALHVALLARGVGPGDEVIVPDLTFVATAAAVFHAGATPVLVDVDPKTFALDVELTKQALTDKTRAIIPVHLYGVPAPMTALRDAVAGRDIFILEDAAEAHGARVDGKRAGGLGDAAAFSFYGNKLLTTGEGGCITTDDAALAKRIRFLKDHAMSPERRYFHPEVGFNYRMTNLQAALGCAQIERFEGMFARKLAILAEYRDAFRGTDIELNATPPGSEPACWLVTALLPGEWTRERQTAMVSTLRRDHGVDVRPFFVPVHEMPPYAQLRFVKNEGPARSVSEEAAVRGICLPSSNKLTSAEISRVVHAVKSAL